MHSCVHILFVLEVEVSVILSELCLDFIWVMCMNTSFKMLFFLGGIFGTEVKYVCKVCKTVAWA
jgi:hypothetical protein